MGARLGNWLALVLVGAFLGGCLWLLGNAAILGLVPPALATRLEPRHSTAEIGRVEE